MKSHSRFGLLVLLTALLSLGLEMTQAVDVNVYAVHKSQKFNQTSPELPTLGGNTPYRIGAEVVPAASGTVLSAALNGPVGAPNSLTYDPLAADFSFQAKYATEAQLDAAAPIGTYTLTVSTLHDGQRTLTLNLPAAAYPNGPHITDFALAQTVNPAAAFTLTWDPFVNATTNDFILLLIADPNTGAAAFRTPYPFQPQALNGLATSLIIPAGTFVPNVTYQAELTFFKTRNTNLTAYPGVPGVVGFASLTDLSITTVPSPAEYGFSLRHFAIGGSFLDGTNPTPSFPVAINGYRAEFTITNAATFPTPAQVLFTGPAGSGFSDAAGDPSAFVSTPPTAFYFSPKISQPPLAPGGAWLVSAAGTPHNFTVPDPQAASRLVVPVPTVTVVSDILKSILWSFYDAAGNALAGTPAVVNGIRVQALDTAGALLYDSGPLPSTASAYVFTSPVTWSGVNTLRFIYGDNLNNSYAVGFSNVSGAQSQLAALAYSGTGGFTLRLTGQVGHGYLLQSSTDLNQWTDLVTTNLPAASVEIVDPQAGSHPYGFYRSKLVN